MWINREEILFIRVKNPNDARELLDLMKRGMMYYAQEAQIPLYRRDGSYNLAALNESRGDLIEAMQNEHFLAFQWQGQFISSARLIFDYNAKKCLLTRFSVDPKLIKSNISEDFLDQLLAYARKEGMEEIYLYLAQDNLRLMDLMKSKYFMLYSINSGRPYPKVCLVKKLRRK